MVVLRAIRKKGEEPVVTMVEVVDGQLAGSCMEATVNGGSASMAMFSAQVLTDVQPSPRHKQVHDLAKLEWCLSGFVPNLELVERLKDLRSMPDAEISCIPAPVPGSVQMALLQAGAIPDWNIGLNARRIEWIENRDWVYQVYLPDEWVGSGRKLVLRCLGLDYSGEILLNGKRVLRFDCTFTPYTVDLRPFLAPSGNMLQFRFDPPPRYLGQYGETSLMKAWKARFYYYWDWTSRMVQTGIWDTVSLDVIQEASIEVLRCTTAVDADLKHGSLHVFGAIDGPGKVRLSLRRQGRTLRTEDVDVETFSQGGVHWLGLPVELWWPNGMGEQPLYDVVCELLDYDGKWIERQTRRVGFKKVEWRLTRGAAKDAEPWLCAVNGKEFFLFGIDWAPIRPNFADLVEKDYHDRLVIYRDCNMNILRVWGGGFLEKQCFYDLCDEMGLLVWQEFPLSSSGGDNYPPDDAESIESLACIAESYVERLQQHPCLLAWCGGNELQDDRLGMKSSQPTLTIKNHPVLVRFAEIVEREDPGRRFVATSPYGPEGHYNLQHTGKGLYWDAHGPWNFNGPVNGAWKTLWESSDAMIHSEMGAPAASSAAMIRRYKGNYKETPGTHDNPLWNRQAWWIDWPKFVEEKGREPGDLEEFVAWSQQRQSDALVLAASILRSKFPACGGLIIWMGHDSFPCTAAPSLMDFEGTPRPALLALGKLFQKGQQNAQLS